MDRYGQFLASVSPRRFFCTSCHVPQNVVAPPVTNDFVDIDTMLSRAAPGELALHEWSRLKANDSLECRNCHSAASMDITKQSPRASVAHQRFLFPGEKTCIDCHKGIAHHLPDMRGVPGWQ
jgi:nitrate/TMAO reductase-like tetraheme cytochrome c subunit